MSASATSEGEGDRLLEAHTEREPLRLEVDTFAAEPDPFKTELCLYSSHFLSTWGQRSHEFFIGLVSRQGLCPII